MKLETARLKNSRRKFVKTVSASGATIGFGGVGLAQILADSADKIRFEEEDKFHYIVVGSGAGGGPVACRLAERGYRVLVLEAGGKEQSLNYEVPAFSTFASEDEKMTWEFYVRYSRSEALERQNSKYDAVKKGVYYPRAATLGGCTAHNAMITLCPDNYTWDSMSRLVADESFHSDHMQQYFKKIERCEYLDASYKSPQDREAALKLHGTNGWLPTNMVPPGLISKDTSFLPFLFAAAASSKSLSRALFMGELDPNQWEHILENKEGLYNTPMSTSQGRRHGSREFLLDTAKKYNLKIETDALVTKILFDQNKKAVGVSFLKGQALYKADPRNAKQENIGQQKVARLLPGGEVILAGGAFNSPQLLQLSGIGNATELSGIIGDSEIIADLPAVGTNLQDRYEICLVSELKQAFKAAKDCTFGVGSDPCLAEWYKKKGDSLYAQNGVAAGIKRKSAPHMPPDLYVFALPGIFNGYYKGYSKNIFDGYKQFTWAILKGHSQNYYDETLERGGGTVKIRSSNPLETPEISFNNFDRDPNGEDLSAVREGLKYARKIMNHFAVKNRTESEIAPGEGVDSDEALDQYIRREAWGHHASCSNPMGVSPRNSVVDQRFKVHGVEGLRIVDASIFPRIPGLFIVTPIYMMSEKAADTIIEDSAFKI
ncbi:MAG: GMC family oxidoreductase [Oligoflexales bacterium]|nr:GMC family oxidoreductase [Oligoflexales bacterium]